MGGYIRIDKDQPTDTRLLDLADMLADSWKVTIIRGTGMGGLISTGEDLSENDNRHALRNALLGALVTLWSYADTHIRSDNTLPVTLSGLAPILGLPVTVLEAFPACWIIESEEGVVTLPGYCEKNGLTAKDIRRTNAGDKREHNRELARNRQRKHRETVRSHGHAKSVTKKRRDVRDKSVTTGTGTGPLDLTSTGPLAAESAGAGGPASSPRNSEPELPPIDPQTRALGLHRAGLTAVRIAQKLRREGVTLTQVNTWLGIEPAPEAA